MRPNFGSRGWVVGGVNLSEDGGGDAVIVDVELELLGAGGSHQTQSLGVGFLPDLDGGEFVGGGLC